MDFSNVLSGIGLGGEFSTPVGAAIERATSEILIGADWAANIEICDQINQREDGPVSAVKALKRRLKSDNPKVLCLTLTLCEAAVKNCRRPLHQAIGSREFLTEIMGLANGRIGWDVQEQALSLIQQWGLAFQSDQSLYFGDAYNRMRSQGVQFPRMPDGAPVFTPPPSAPSGAGGRAGAKPPQGQMEKLQADMQSVVDKVMLCRSMLPGSTGVEKDETLLELVGFLEACRPRMVDLIEAGMGGVLGEGLFEDCLKINDALLRTLEAERTGTTIPVEDLGLTLAGGKGAGVREEGSLIDFGTGSEGGGEGGGRDTSQGGVVGQMGTFSIGGTGDDEDILVARPSPSTTGRGKGKLTLGAVPLKSDTASTTAATAGSATSKDNDKDLEAFLDSLTEGTSGAAGSGKGSGNELLGDDDLEKEFS